MTKHQRRAAPDRASLYDDITNKIIAELKDDRLTWVQPWAPRRPRRRSPCRAMPRRGAVTRGSTS